MLETKTVLLDTNFLIAVFEQRVDVIKELGEALEEPFRALVPAPCLNELKALKAGKKLFPLAEKYLRENGVGTASAVAQSADDAILECALEENAAVCTNDFALKQRLKKAGVQVITLKNRKLVLN